MDPTQKADPFFKMKLALVKTILAEPNPTLDFLEQTFVEEFGSPPAADLVALFQNELRKRPATPGAAKRIRIHVNLIRDIARQKAAERLQKDFEAMGGTFLRVAIDADLLQTIQRLASVYGARDHQEVIVLALKMLEQKAKRMAPEVFRY